MSVTIALYTKKRGHETRLPVKTRVFVRAAAACGIAGPVLLASVLAVLSFLERDFMRTLGWNPLTAPTHDWPSGLALGPLGAVMTVTFVISGVMLMAFAWGLRETFPAPSAGRAASALLVAAGLAMTLLAFSTDPTDSAAPATLHGRIHDTAFVALGVSMLASLAVFAAVFLRRKWRVNAVLSLVTCALIFPSFTVKGTVFYFFLAAALAWWEAAALRMRHDAPAMDAAAREEYGAEKKR